MNILIVDDHPLIVDSLSAVLLGLDPGHRVVAASDLPGAINAVSNAGRFDIVFLDLGLPGCVGVTALERLIGKFPDLPIAVITGNIDRQAMIAACEFDIEGFLPKTLPQDQLVDALRKILANEPYFPPTDGLGLIPRATSQRAAPSWSPRAELGRAGELTQRQLEVLDLLIQGYPNKLIARKLNISNATVKAHLSNIFRALNVTSRLQAVAHAHQAGLLVDAAHAA